MLCHIAVQSDTRCDLQHQKACHLSHSVYDSPSRKWWGRECTYCSVTPVLGEIGEMGGDRG